ncbi:MAG: 4Fe-4S dicluster-binding protein [Fibrobacterota bacterium]
MKEIVIVSGKGGTGKTSLTASFAALCMGKAVFADCDVDAADIHLILNPDIKKRTAFKSGHKAVIRRSQCIGCGGCLSWCRFGAVLRQDIEKGEFLFTIDPVACEGCGVCVRFCPIQAIDFAEPACGEWYISDTRFGPLVHARLGVGAENSGKLVTLVRNEAKGVTHEKGAEYLLIDGAPGIGCPVIASLIAADLAIIVTEPTVSGDHDLRRIVQLTKQLGTPAMICINKWDINPDAANTIRQFAEKAGVPVVGVIRYDKAATDSQRVGKAVVEHRQGGMADDIRAVWENITSRINNTPE